MIIGLMGQSRVGKDTAGAVLAAELGGTTLAFADPIKRWCMLALGLREEQLWGDDKEKPIKKSQLKVFVPKGQPRPLWADYLLDACCASRQVNTDAEWAMRVNTDVEWAMRKWWKDLRQEPGLTPRRVMQHFGTEFVRKNLGPKFWVEIGIAIADRLLEGGHRYSRDQGLIPNAQAQLNAVVFTDVRFRNEVVAIKRRGGEVYGITRDVGWVNPAILSMKKTKGVVKVKMRGAHVVAHASEQEQLSVPQFWLDGRLINRFGTKEEFEGTVRYVARKIAARGPVLF